MKRVFIASIGAIALTTIPLIGAIPGAPNIWNAKSAIAQNVVNQPKVNLQLVADQQVLQKNAQGKEVTTWKSLGSKVTVKPGDVIRFTVTGKNEGKSAAKSLAMTQAIARGMVYVLNSATPVNGATLTYSIDQGKTFVVNPTIKVTLANGKVEERPAPATAYTHVRWKLTQALEPNTSIQAAYFVKVR